MNEIAIQYYRSPYGELMLGSFDQQLCLCDWRYRTLRTNIDSRLSKGLQASYVEQPSKVIDETIEQLEEYFFEQRKTFEIPLLFVGTEFQKCVWNALLQIPYGQTDTYLGLSHKIGNKLAIRAVAAANGANAISIIVPCHRIIGSKSELIGYAGGLPTKQKLLQLENKKFNALESSQLILNFD